MYKSQNKWCYVPGCKNTSISAPNKLFLTVPQDYSRKVLWFKAARRDFPKSKSMFFCCEDHFNLEQDMENYIHYKLVGGKIFLKAGVVPHVFNCQQDRKRAASAPERSLPLKRERKRLVEEALSSERKQTNYSPAAIDFDQSLYQPSTSAVAVTPEEDTHIAEVIEEDMANYIRFKFMGGRKKMKPKVVPHIFDCQLDRKRLFSMCPRVASVKRDKRSITEDAIASTSTITKQDDSTSGSPASSSEPLTDTDLERANILPQKSFFSKRNVSIQTNPIMVRSKAVQCKLYLEVGTYL